MQEESGAAGTVVEAPPPITAEILTVPRVVGSGCLATLSLVPALDGVGMLLVVAVFSRQEVSREEFDRFQVSVTHEATTETFGFGVLSGQRRVLPLPRARLDDRDFEFCFYWNPRLDDEEGARPMRFVWPSLAFLVGLVPLIAPLAPTPHPLLIIASALWIAALAWFAPRKPELALLLTAPLFAVNNLWAMATTMFVVFAASRSIPRLGRLWALLGVTIVLQTAFGLVQVHEAMPLWEELIGGVAGSVFFVAFPAVSGMLLGRRRPMVRLLQERNEYLERARAWTAVVGPVRRTRAHRRRDARHARAPAQPDLHPRRGAGADHRATPLELHEQAELIRTTSSLAMAELREILARRGRTPN